MKEIRATGSRSPLRLSNEMCVAAQQAAPHKKTTPPPFSIRFIFKERTRLEKAAAGMPLGACIRQKLFGGEMIPLHTKGRKPVRNYAELARVLGALVALCLSSELNQIARAASMGARCR